MKQSALLLASVTLLLLFSCSDDINEELVYNEELPVPIRLAVSETDSRTRAIVNSISDISVNALGIYEVAEGNTAGTFPWTPTPLLSNTAPSGISGNQLTFSPKLYYPMGGRKVIFYGYYPRTTATSGANYVTPPNNGIAPTFNFTLTGQEDIMHAISNSSSSTPPGTAATLTFNHKLTQIQLSFSALSAILTGIKILNVKNIGTMNLETGVITYSSGTTDFSLSKANLTTSNPILVPAGVPGYVVEVALLGLIPTRRYLIKPTSGNFLAGIIYTITLN